MRTFKFVIVLVLAICLVVPNTAFAQGKTSLDKLGEKLVRQLWEDIKNKEWDKLERSMPAGFQSVHVDGARDKEGE